MKTSETYPSKNCWILLQNFGSTSNQKKKKKHKILLVTHVHTKVLNFVDQITKTLTVFIIPSQTEYTTYRN